MPNYNLDAVGTNSSVGSGNLSPGLPAGLTGLRLLVLHTGVNSASIGSAPTISGWQNMTPTAGGAGAAGEAVYFRIWQAGDAAPVFQWDASHQAFARIASWSGDVYTDLSTILALSPVYRGANTSGTVAVNAISVPSLDDCLVLRGGHCVKTATNNGSSFLDWNTNPGILTKIGTDVVQTNNGPAGTWWYWQQTSALGLSADICPLTNSDTTNNSQGWTLVLKTSAVAAPIGESSFPDSLTRKDYQKAVQQFWSVPDTILALSSVDVPISTYDYPNPKRLSRPSSIYEVPTNVIPLGTDRVLPPFQWDYEWDKPSLPLALRAECYGLSANELFALNNLPPYQEFNWPVPPGPRQFLRDFQSSFNKNLIGQDILPPGGPQKNMWDPPRGPRRSVENLSSLDSGLSLYFFVPPKPVGAQSQDLPPQPARRLRPDFSQGLEASRLTFLSTLPSFQPCDALPLKRLRRLMFLSYDYNGSLLYLKINTIPVGGSTQENPRLSRRARSSSLYEITEYPFLNPPLPPPGPPASSGQVAGPGGRIILMPKKVGETVIRPFDFISRLGGGERILSAVTTASVYSGTDSSPQNIINGSAAISGTIVNQSLTAGILGVIYELLCTITTSSGQRLEMSAFWVVEPDLP